MSKRKAGGENIYDVWLESAKKLNPPYDYFTFAELSNSNEAITNTSYHNILLKALSKANMSNTNSITNAINVCKVYRSLDHNSNHMKLSIFFRSEIYQIVT
jgi:hypothetical protein